MAAFFGQQLQNLRPYLEPVVVVEAVCIDVAVVTTNSDVERFYRELKTM
jgi:hypothetical protein